MDLCGSVLVPLDATFVSTVSAVPTVAFVDVVSSLPVGLVGLVVLPELKSVWAVPGVPFLWVCVALVGLLRTVPVSVTLTIRSVAHDDSVASFPSAVVMLYLCTRKDHSGLKNCLGAAESTTAAEATRHYFGPFLMAAASDRLPELVRREFRRTWIANSGCERGRRVTALVVRGLSVDRSVVVNTRSFHDE